jgi:hypothetical protein
MLREIKGVLQDDPALRRRWFQDDYFDLFLWTDREGALQAFQLAYERGEREKVLSWERVAGYSHRRVASGEGSVFGKMTPLLAAQAGRFPKYRVISAFDTRAAVLEAPVRRAVRARLAAYFPRADRPRRPW